MTDKTEASEREIMAFTLWRAEAVRAAPNIAKMRSMEAFQDQSDETRGKWLSQADAVMDVAQAMVAAAFDLAGQHHDRHADFYRAVSFPDCAAHEEHARRIRALTPDDARAALDRLIAEAVEAEREACAKAVEGVKDLEKDHWSPEYRQGCQSACIGAAGVIRARKDGAKSG